MRTLFVHTGGIGDFLLACPALERLAADGPVEIAGIPERAELAVAAGLAARTHTLDAMDFTSVLATPSARTRGFLARFDRAIVWMRDDDGLIAAGLRDCGVKEVRCFPGVPPDNWTRHASEYYLECLGYAPQGRFRLRVSPSPGLEVVIQPGSGSARKNWRLEQFRQLSAALCARRLQVAWCLGPAEKELRPPEPCVALRGLPLYALAQALAGARLYVGNDSGITHLAAAVGCPTIAIFGPTDPEVWAPRGTHVRVAFDPKWPTVREVMRQVRAFLT